MRAFQEVLEDFQKQHLVTRRSQSHVALEDEDGLVQMQLDLEVVQNSDFVGPKNEGKDSSKLVPKFQEIGG